MKQTEADLCKKFISETNLLGWKSFPEQNGWDILTILPDGRQIGIQAKLTFNLKVLDQCLPKLFDGNIGPDFRAILVPEDKYPNVAKSLGIVVFVTVKEDFLKLFPQMSETAKISLLSSHYNKPISDNLGWYPDKRYKIPEYESGSVAGSPCPVRLTDWKIKALKLIARCEKRGYVTTKDFKQLGISPTMWLYSNRKWLKLSEPGRYVLNKCNIHLTHPEAYAKILAETKLVE